MRYLVVTYIKKPDGKIDEQVEITKKIKERDLTMSNIILDFKDQKVQKSTVNGQQISSSWNVLVEHYRKVYPDYIAELEKLQE